MTTKRTKQAKDFKSVLSRQLQDAELAAGYLTEAFEEGDAEFLLALKDVADAMGGIGKLAKKTSLNREGLYELLSRTGNPRLSSLSSILDTLGFEVAFRPKPRDSQAA